MKLMSINSLLCRLRATSSGVVGFVPDEFFPHNNCCHLHIEVRLLLNRVAPFSVILTFLSFDVLGLRYIKKIYPLSDPRNLPHNPDLNIPRSVISGDGDSMSSSFDMSHNDSAKTLSIQSTPDMLMNHHKKYSNTPLTSLYDVESPLLSGEALLDSETSLMVNRPTSERYFVENAADSPHAPTRQRRNLSTSKDENTEI